MKAIAYRRSLPSSDPHCFEEIDLPDPVATGRDILVQVKAVSVNPVDTKLRLNMPPPEGEARVLGFDAVGVVKAVGEGVTLFKPGDEVWYAGSRIRSGSNAQLQLVDERIVGKKPRSLSDAQAAAMPLTGLTAWEALFDCMKVPGKDTSSSGQASLLITAGAGGVGSIAVQLARQLTGVKVISTASRPESRAAVERLGAHVVLDHREALSETMKKAGLKWVDYIFGVSHTNHHFVEMSKIIAPQGKICVIDDPGPIDIRLLRPRCASFHWEGMFTRSTFETPDMGEQGRILNELARLVDQGVIACTHSETLGKITAQNLAKAHAMVESNHTIGKITLSEF